MTVPSFAEAEKIVRKLGMAGVTGREGLADFGIHFMREALAVTQEQRGEPDMLAASILGLEAIDNILSSHEGQAEYQQLKSAFDALEAAIAKAEKRDAPIAGTSSQSGGSNAGR